MHVSCLIAVAIETFRLDVLLCLSSAIDVRQSFHFFDSADDDVAYMYIFGTDLQSGLQRSPINDIRRLAFQIHPPAPVRFQGLEEETKPHKHREEASTVRSMLR